MKGNKKLLVIAILLLMMSVGFTTYAIYRESTTATGTIKAAAWQVKVKKAEDTGEAVAISTANLTFGINDITWTTHTGKNDTIAPGDTGYIDFTVDATGSEVDVILTAALGSGASTLPDGMTAQVATGTQTIQYAASNMTGTVRVNVTWTGTLADESTKDTTDLAVGKSNETARTLSIPVELTARQKLASDV